MYGAAVVSLDKVSVRFGRLGVLDAVSAVFSGGQVVAVRGENGAGKTTLLRVLVNVFQPNSGRRTGPRRSAYVPAGIEPPSLAAMVWLAGIPRKNRTDPAKALRVLGFDGELRAPCRSLSFGNLRKLLLAEAFTSGEELVVVDEASLGLDDHGLDGLRQLVDQARRSGQAVVLADQQSRPIPWSDRTIEISGGALAEGSPDSTVTEVTLRGPRHRARELLAVAADLDFLPKEGGSP